MKVVLFCGGYGMRMRNGEGDLLPKPLQMVGTKPLLWHVMKYYAHFGHTEFVLCLGYGAQQIKDFFAEYAHAETRDFVLRRGQVEVIGERSESSDVCDWTITFVDTGLETPIGERLRRVRPYLDGDEYFLANYADVLSDAPLDLMVERVRDTGAAASMIVVPPQSSFHVVDTDDDGRVTGIQPVSNLPMGENGGFFVLSQEVFDRLPENGDLVADACGALLTEGRLLGYRWDGFWKPADTFKERAELDQAWSDGSRPWAVWEK
jgi:glucose-1-phosphate cytidylyltransferase